MRDDPERSRSTWDRIGQTGAERSFARASAKREVATIRVRCPLRKANSSHLAHQPKTGYK